MTKLSRQKTLLIAGLAAAAVLVIELPGLQFRNGERIKQPIFGWDTPEARYTSQSDLLVPLDCQIRMDLFWCRPS